jgi:hypothetical protein
VKGSGEDPRDVWSREYGNDARAQAPPEYAQFVDTVRREILEYFSVAGNQLDWMILRCNDDSDKLWAEVNRQRSVLGTGEVRGDL